MKSTIVATFVWSLICVAAAADELTLGEREFIKRAGRECPVVRLWPEGKTPDEPKKIGEETFGRLNQSHGETRRAVEVSLTEFKHVAGLCDERTADALEAG